LVPEIGNSPQQKGIPSICRDRATEKYQMPPVPVVRPAPEAGRQGRGERRGTTLATATLATNRTDQWNVRTVQNEQESPGPAAWKRKHHPCFRLMGWRAGIPPPGETTGGNGKIAMRVITSLSSPCRILCQVY